MRITATFKDQAGKPIHTMDIDVVGADADQPNLALEQACARAFKHARGLESVYDAMETIEVQDQDKPNNKATFKSTTASVLAMAA